MKNAIRTILATGAFVPCALPLPSLARAYAGKPGTMTAPTGANGGPHVVARVNLWGGVVASLGSAIQRQ